MSALESLVPTRSVCVAGTPLARAAAASGRLLTDVRTASDVRSLPGLVRSIPQDRRAITRGIADCASIVHITISSPWDAVFLGAATRADAPILLTIHDGERHLGEENRILEAIEDRVIAMADHVACLSRPVYETISRSGRVNKPLHLVENALLVRSDEPLPARPASRSHPMRLLFLGRLYPYKGLDVALDTMNLLAATGEPAVLVIAGRGDLGPYSDRIERLGNRVEVDNRWLSTEDIGAHLRDSAVMFMPYREASQSGVALDALWAALPTVATRVGALPEQLTDGVNALFSEPGDAESMAASIRRLAHDPALYEKLSRGAFDAYQAMTPQAVARRWLDLYDEISKEPR